MTSKQHNKPHHVQVKMHSRLLHLRPHYYEEQYFSQVGLLMFWITILPGFHTRTGLTM